MYTKEAETADQYIEKTVKKIARDHAVNRGNFGCAGAGDHPGAGRPPDVSGRSAGRSGAGDPGNAREHLGKGGTLRTYLFDCLDGRGCRRDRKGQAG